GTNVLTDPIYNSPEMHNVSRAVIDNPEGTIMYTFWDQNSNRQVKKQAVWKTLDMDNQEWRVGVVRDTSATPVEKSGD
ncbi:MAG: hypothetical protein LUQ50_05030, partial [Methanospirillum sp.]|nr:hypothetical protein [Methanospirillum sp.]